MSASVSWDEVPDDELVVRVRAGDVVAFRGIVERYSPMMLGFFLKELGFDQFEQAEDLASETMTAAWTTLRNGRSAPPDNLRAWLFGTARNVLSSYFREKFTRREVLVFEPETYDLEDPRALDDFREVEYEQGLPRFLELVDDAIESMPAKYRDVVRVNMRDGSTGRALAAQVGVTPAEASRRLNEARPKLVNAVGALLMARTCREACPKFDSYLQAAEWAGGPFGEELRQRLMQHIHRCPTCGSARSRDKWIVFLPAVAPILVTPELRQRILNVAFATKDGGLSSASLDPGRRFDNSSSANKHSSTMAGYTYSFTDVSDLSTRTPGASGDAVHSSGSILKGNEGSNSSKRPARLLLLSLFLLLFLMILGIFVDRPISAQPHEVVPPVARDAAPPGGGAPQAPQAPQAPDPAPQAPQAPDPAPQAPQAPDPAPQAPSGVPQDQYHLFHDRAPLYQTPPYQYLPHPEVLR